MENSTFDHIRYVMRRDYPNYVREQVATVLDEKKIMRKKLISYKSFFGIKYKKDFLIEEVCIKFVDDSIVYSDCYGIKKDVTQIRVAVDEENKTVYWNYRSVRDNKI